MSPPDRFHHAALHPLARRGPTPREGDTQVKARFLNFLRLGKPVAATIDALLKNL